jgi:mRNA interferase MazF
MRTARVGVGGLEWGDRCVLGTESVGAENVTVVPVTLDVKPIYPFQTHLPAALTGLAQDAKTQAEQTRWIDAANVGERVGMLPPATLISLNDAIRLHLSL